jgi:predicted acyl esterase
MIKWLAVVWIVSCVVGVASAAENLDFHAPATAAGAATAQAMRSLAERALPVYENPDRAEFLANLSALQMVADEYSAADATRQTLHEYREQEKTARPVDMAMIYDLYVTARARAKQSGKPFAETFADAFHTLMDRLSDPNAFTLSEWLETPLSVYEGNLQRDLDRLQGKRQISLDEAIDLAWAYLSLQAFRSFDPSVGKLIAADDAKRYVMRDEVIAGPGRTHVSVVVIRPSHAAAPVPALLEFTSDPDSRDRARECAAHGYAGVVAHPQSSESARAASTSSSPAGDDTRAVIEWIAKQKWNDGRVGLYGSGQSALAAWAAAQDAPRALAALAASSVAAPASPKRGFERRRRRPRARGRSTSIGYSVLTTTGYFDTNEAASLAYFTAEHRRDPSARQWLLIGPYDSQAMRRGTLPVLGGYSIDAAAIVDLRELRFQWFDHVLRGSPLPRLLAGRVNFEVMGANLWRHAETLAAMANGSVRLYPNESRIDGHNGLSGHEPSKREVAEALVRLSGAVAGSAGGSKSGAGNDVVDIDDSVAGITTDALGSRDSVVFVSGPLYRPLEVSGSVSGVLDFAAPLAGLSVDVEVYELSPRGDYFRFLSVPDAVCEDCVRSRRTHRGRPSEERRVVFASERLTSVELPKGSRIVLVLQAQGHPPKRKLAARRRHHPALQPLPTVSWFGDSFIELPVWRDGPS